MRFKEDDGMSNLNSGDSFAMRVATMYSIAEHCDVAVKDEI